MMKERGKDIRLFEDPNMKKYILEDCKFERVVYKKHKLELESIAIAVLQGDISHVTFNTMCPKEEVIQKACEIAVPRLKKEIRKRAYIIGYLTTDFVKNEDKEALLEDIAKLIIEE